MALRAGLGGVSGLQNQPTAQGIGGSLKLDASQKLYFTQTFGGVGNRKIFTWSCWLKLLQQSTIDPQIFGTFTDSNNRAGIYFDDSDGNTFGIYSRIDGTTNTVVETTRVFRDYSGGWTHFMIAVDTTLDTSTDRVKIYINGEQQTDLSQTSYPSQHYSYDLNISSTTHYFNRYGDAEYYVDCFASQFNFVDGQALGPESFGFTDPLTNTWKPKKFIPTKVNDGRTWSSGISNADSSYPGTNLFDGNLGTYTEGTNGGGDVTFSGSITGSTIEFYGNKQGSSTLSVNGVDKTSLVPASVGWFTITGVTNITALAFNRGASGNYVDLYAIRVDGVILLDADTSNFGRNGCYLPFDGSALIGQDQSRRGNDWTPINFGGSVALDSSIVSGARPLLNTVQGGSQADLGVFGSKENVGYAVTVYDDGGGNKYYIDGVKQATLTGLLRGATYTFDTSDSTVATHPFVFGSTANGNNFARGANYGSVSAGTAGAATTITIPYDAPETLYYHCSSHSGMGGSIVGIHTDETKADQYASNCVLALPLVSAISDVSASVACTSTTKTMSSGNATVAGEQSNFYANSYNLTGSSSYINTSAGTDFAYGTVDFTVEAWIFSTNTSNNTIYTQVVSGTNYFVIVYNSNNTVSFLSSGGNLTTTNTLARDKWHHVAVVRKSGTVSIYLNGQKAVSGSITYDFSNTSYNPTVGTYTHSVNTENLTGYIQDFRIYKGAAKYDGDFVVPSTTPDIVPVSPTGVSGGSKLAKITNGGTSFAGTATSKLTLADSTDFTFGSNDFAIEFWYYTQTLDGTYNIFFDCMGSNRSGIQLAIETDGDYRIEVGDGSNNWIWQLTDKDAKAGKWTHFALTRESNKIRFFEDGKFIAQQTSSTAVGDPRSPAIGGYASDDSTNYGFEGIISNFRIVNGSAVYTTDFTPSRSPLTNITNTKLLCCQSPTVVTEGAVKPGDITAVGDTAASTFNPFNTDVRTVRGQESDYMTISPLSIGTNSVTISDGNFHFNSGGTNQAKRGSITFPSTGKWFWEMTMEDGGSGVWLLGVSGADNQNGAGRLCYVSDARKLDESNSFAGYGRGYTVGDVIGVALDLDEDTLAFYKNGVFLGTAFTTVSTRLPNGISAYFQGEYSGRSFYLNSGQKPFKFPPPAGFQPPNTANTRPEDVISRPNQYVDAVAYTSNNGTAYEVTGLNFSPDLILTKNRDNSSGDWNLQDTVCGITSVLTPNYNYEASTQTDNINSVTANGFTVGTGSRFNSGTQKIISWVWKAGGPKFGGQTKEQFWKDGKQYSSAAAVGLTGGTITPTACSIGSRQSFNIIRYTGNATSGATLPHGLGKVPTLIIAKRTGGGTSDWLVGHKSIATNWGGVLYLNQGQGEYDQSEPFNDTAPTSTLITMSDSSSNNGSGGRYVMYLWADTPGLFKTGKYVNNANDDGPYMECGFKPALVLLKCLVSGSTSWRLADIRRDPINDGVGTNWLKTNSGNGDADERPIDFLSTGFKIRKTAGGDINQSSSAGSINYIFAAWAEAPSIDLLGGGANAR